MKVSNLKITGLKGSNKLDYEFTATIDITTGFWIWKKTKTHEIAKSYFGSWAYTSTGRWVPGFDVEALERVERHKTGKTLIELGKEANG